MDPVSLHQIITLGAALQIGGPILAVLFIWWIDRRDIQKILKGNQEQINAYREDTRTIATNHNAEIVRLQISHQEDVQRILTAYKEDMLEQRRMYADNIVLVKAHNRLSADQKDIILLNTQALDKLTASLKYNLLCPYVMVKEG